jgi:hypothetical protein
MVETFLLVFSHKESPSKSVINRLIWVYENTSAVTDSNESVFLLTTTLLGGYSLSSPHQSSLWRCTVPAVATAEYLENRVVSTSSQFA